jgi:hypothetical protein
MLIEVHWTVEVLDVNLEPFAGFDRAASRPLQSNAVSHLVS